MLHVYCVIQRVTVLNVKLSAPKSYVCCVLIMCLQRVKQLYQDANLGRNFKVVKFIEISDGKCAVPVIKPNITTVADGWNMQYCDSKLVCINNILSSGDS